jgi:hypothetical protein
VKQEEPGHIFNLGHGVYPEVPTENVELVVGKYVNTNRRFKESGQEKRPASINPIDSRNAYWPRKEVLPDCYFIKMGADLKEPISLWEAVE